MLYFWIVLALAILAAAAWFFLPRIKKSASHAKAEAELAAHKAHQAADTAKAAVRKARGN